MQLLIVWLITAVALLVTARIVPGFEIRDFGTALLAALVVGLANAVLWPALFLLALPLTALTLGLFTFVLSALMLKLTSMVVTNFRIRGWLPALTGAVVLALVNALLRYLLPFY